LSGSAGASGFNYPGGYAVAFPDGSVEGVQLPVDMPRGIIIDKGDLDDLPRRLHNLYNSWCKGEARTPGEAGVQAAIDLLARSWEIRTPLALEIRDEAEQIRTLTEA